MGKGSYVEDGTEIDTITM